MERIGADHVIEVLYERTIWCERLSADTCAASLEVFGLHCWHKALQRAAELRFAERAADFVGAHGRVPLEKAPKTGVGQRVEGIGGRNVAPPIAFASQSQHGIGTSFDAAMDHASKVDS